MKQHPKNIAIVGGGPVGSMMAIYLANRGLNVTVFEGRPDLRQQSIDAGRSINLALSARGIKALEEIGLDQAMKANAVPMTGRMMHGAQGELSFLPYGEQGQFINSISRSGLNRALVEEAIRLGTIFRFDHRCVAVDIDRSELTLSHHGETLHHPADAIIGADGMFSVVRQSMQTHHAIEFSQQNIDHGYKELTIPSVNHSYALEKNALHIWPRKSFMLIALPNPDTTFTATLFLPLHGTLSFDQLVSPENIRDFFNRYFPDAAALMPDLMADFRHHPTSSLSSIRCFPWVTNNVILLGDAAHGIVPFYGQGMNAGFEDCRILNRLLAETKNDWTSATQKFQQLRKPDADAIAQLALDNFVEMRDLVGTPDFLLRKKIEARLHELFPTRWIPLYSMVTFHDDLRYSDAYRTGQRQKTIMDTVMKMPQIESQWPSIDFDAVVNQL